MLVLLLLIQLLFVLGSRDFWGDLLLLELLLELKLLLLLHLVLILTHFRFLLFHQQSLLLLLIDFHLLLLLQQHLLLKHFIRSLYANLFRRNIHRKLRGFNIGSNDFLS